MLQSSALKWDIIININIQGHTRSRNSNIQYQIDKLIANQSITSCQNVILAKAI